ncbi:unnamed protein product [Closterium sp. NIES-53]
MSDLQAIIFHICRHFFPRSPLPPTDTSLVDNNNLTQPFPEWVTACTSLEIIQLSNNTLTGTLPALKNMTRLHTLLLCNCIVLPQTVPSFDGLPALASLCVTGYKILFN